MEDINLKLERLENEIKMLKEEVKNKENNIIKTYKTTNLYNTYHRNDFTGNIILLKDIYDPVIKKNIIDSYLDYETEEQAENEFKYYKFERLLERVIKYLNEKNFCDFSNIKIMNRFLCYDYKEDIIDTGIGVYGFLKQIKKSLLFSENVTIDMIINEISKEGYTKEDLEWYLKY